MSLADTLKLEDFAADFILVREQIGEVGHHFGQGSCFLADAHHADVKPAEQTAMLLHGGGKRDAPAHGIGKLQHDFF